MLLLVFIGKNFERGEDHIPPTLIIKVLAPSLHES